MPSGPLLTTAVIEYQEVTADFIWLKAVQFIGKRGDSEDPSGHNYDWFYKIIDLVTDLDPQFSYVYEAGGAVLSVLSDNVSSSNALLEKGIRYNPAYWQIPFYLGFNYMYHLKDNLKAAQYVEHASKIEGRPAYLPFLAATLYAKGNDPQTAILFLKGVYLSTKDEKMREKIAERIAEIETKIKKRVDLGKENGNN